MSISSQCLIRCSLLHGVNWMLWSAPMTTVERHRLQQLVDDFRSCWTHYHSGYMQHRAHTGGHSIWHHQCDPRRTSITRNTQWQYCRTVIPKNNPSFFNAQILWQLTNFIENLHSVTKDRIMILEVQNNFWSKYSLLAAMHSGQLCLSNKYKVMPSSGYFLTRNGILVG